MSDEGYTLAEMLAALTILGLAIGGLGLVTNVISRQQWTANQIHARLVEDRAADQGLGRWLAGLDASELSGAARSLSAPCGAGTCRARVEGEGRRTLLVLDNGAGTVRRLPLRQSNPRFSFIHLGGSAPAWPLSSGEESSTLKAVRLSDPDAIVPTALARAWTLESRDCQFDAVAGACRADTP